MLIKSCSRDAGMGVAFSNECASSDNAADADDGLQIKAIEDEMAKTQVCFSNSSMREDRRANASSRR